MGKRETGKPVYHGEHETRASRGQEGIRHGNRETKEGDGRGEKENSAQHETARLKGYCCSGKLNYVLGKKK